MRKCRFVSALVLLGTFKSASATGGQPVVFEARTRTGHVVKLRDLPEGDFIPAGDPKVVAHYSLEELRRPGFRPAVPLVVDPNAYFSNVTNFEGTGFVNGGTADQAGNLITRLVADDLTMTATPPEPGVGMTKVVLAVFNGNVSAVSVRARIRFWNATGSPGVPGTYYAPGGTNIGYSFNPFSFASGVTVLTGTLPATPVFSIPAGATLWAGMTFDNNTGGTGATLAQMDNFGMGRYNDPPDVGSSTDNYFITEAAGSFFPTSSPAGSVLTFGGTPYANFGWELATPVELQSFRAE